MSAIRSEIKELSSVERELSIVIPHETVVRETDKAYQRLSQQVKLKGFRQGKVPRSVLEQFYKTDVEQDVTERVVNLGYQEAIVFHNIDPVAEPTLENLSSVKTPSDFSFTAKVQIKPVIHAPVWKELNVTAHTHVLDASLVDVELERLRDQHSTLVPVSDRTTIMQGDVVDCNIKATLDQQPVAELSGDKTLEIGSAGFLAEVEQALVGQSVGTTTPISVTLPDTYKTESLRGQTVSFEVTANTLKTRQKPALDDDFAKDLGEQFETLEAVKAAILESLQKEKEQKDIRHREEAVIDALLANNSFEVPSKWVNKQAEYTAANMLSQFDKEQAARIWKSIGKSLVEEGMPRAERSVRISLLLNTIASENNLTVTEDDVEAELDKEAARYNVSKSRVRAHYKKEELEMLKERILFDKALQMVVSLASISYTDAPLRGKGE